MKITTMLVIVALAAVAMSMPAQATPNQQTVPECSIEDRDSGNSIESDGSALITPLQILRVTCDVSDNSQESTWDFSTELLNPKWSVSDAAGRHPPIFEEAINLKDYSDRLEIELTGNVAWPKVPGQIGSENVTYISETAPGVRTRAVSFSSQSGGPPIHYEVIASHPDYIQALQAISVLNERQPSIADYVRPIRDAANAALEEGRPWRAIELIETMTPVLDTATEHRAEYEELNRDSQAFLTAQFWWGVGIGVGGIIALGLLVVPIVVARNILSNRNRRGSSPDSSEIDETTTETEPTTRRRRPRRRSSSS